MRGHAFLLGNELKTIFKRWQQTNHSQILYVKPGGNIRYSQPTEHKLYCHKSNGRWHVPYVNDEDFQIKMDERNKIEKIQWSCIELADPK